MGAQQNTAARCGGCAGVGRARRKDGGVPRRARRGRFSPGRRGQGAVPGDAAGAFGAGSRDVPIRRRVANGARAGFGRVRRTKAACRARRRGAGTLAGRRGAGGIRRLSGADTGKARAGAAVYGGRDGYNRGRRASYRNAAGGGAGQAKNALSCAACVGLQATGGKAAAARAKKPVFAI